MSEKNVGEEINKLNNKNLPQKIKNEFNFGRQNEKLSPKQFDLDNELL